MMGTPVPGAPACAADEGSWCQAIWDRTGIDWLAEAAGPGLSHTIRIVFILVIALVVRLLLIRAIARITKVAAHGAVPESLRGITKRAEVALLGPDAVDRRAQRANSMGSLMRSTVTVIIFMVTGILVLAEIGVNVAPILASAGIAGIALGFGAQNVVKDFISGVFMLLEDQYGVGDVVDLGTASGTVVGVALRVTTVRSADGVLWYVRNGEILRVGNSSQGAAVVNIDLPLSYRADAAKAGEIALAQAVSVAQTPEFADAIVAAPTLLGITTMTSDAVTIRVSATVQAGTQWGFGRAIRGAVKSAFDAAGIASPVSDLRWHGPTPRPGEPS